MALKRDMRIQSLYQKALKGKYTKDGKFRYDKLVEDAKMIGVAISTAHSYADSVVARLTKAGHLK